MQTAPSACAPAVLAFLLGFAMPSANAQGTNAPKPDFTPKPLYAEAAPVCPCESLTNIVLPSTTIESATVDPADGSCRVTAGPMPIGLTAAITQWVEENRPPDKLIAELHNKEGKVVGTRPVFAYPRVTRYKGSGRTDDAANFESRPR